MRALARWGAMPLLAAPIGAWALGLGDIELRSALNQPFQAEIQLVSATADDLRDLKVVLATREAYASRGLDRADFLSALEFRVAKGQTGRDVVRITSRESITEPFVTMLVEMTWPRGRSLREYTVLLDPPVLLPGPAVPQAVQPAQTRPAESPASGAIDRPAAPPQPARQPPRQPAPVTSGITPPVTSGTTPPVSRAPAASPGGTYGPVQRAETLWAIAQRFRPQGVTMNQMLVAVYQANPQAFAGNMNLLQIGAVLRIPEAVDLQAIGTTAATSEVQRQIDEWQGRPTQQARLRLVPPTEPEEPAAPAAAPSPGSTQARQPVPAPADRPAAGAGAEDGGPGPVAAASEDRRLLELRDEQLQNLQNQANAANEPAAEPEQPPAEAEVAPGVDLESEQLFSDEVQSPEGAVAEDEPQPATPAAEARTIVAEEEPSLVAQIVDWVMTPLLWIGLGVAALLLGAMWFIRRRREEPEDVTGRWEALESEVDDEEIREATERMRRRVPDESFVVEEQPSRPRRAEPSLEEAAQPARTARAAAPPADETLSSHSVINLEQADPVAEADFHMAYGLYDQAAELISKALEAAPNRQDLKVKLLEVFFVWGNKDAFLKAAKGLRKEIGEKPDADWDKVMIMGKQICPDEALFAGATAAAGHVDVDLQAGDSPLDLAFDEGDAGGVDVDFSIELRQHEVAANGVVGPKRPAAKAPARGAQISRGPERDGLDIGERTAAGLEAALFFEDQEQDQGNATTPDLDSLAVTQESPTVETAQSGGGWGADSPTAEISLDGPTVETPTIEAAGPDAPTMETPTVETSYRRSRESPTGEQHGIAANLSDRTAEIDLDDLGLDVEDLAGLPGDLGDLPAAPGERHGHASAARTGRRRRAAVGDRCYAGVAQRRGRRVRAA